MERVWKYKRKEMIEEKPRRGRRIGDQEHSRSCCLGRNRSTSPSWEDIKVQRNFEVRQKAYVSGLGFLENWSRSHVL